MPITNLQTFLVYPNKNREVPHQIMGADVELAGEVFDLLADVFENSEQTCKIDISFDQREDGVAQNDCRDLLLAYAQAPTVANGLPLAIRLGSHTTKRSGLGLLFLAAGDIGREKRVILARFAAHSGIVADEDRNALSVQFIDRVFLKSAVLYKAVMYQDLPSNTAYWTGKATDRQIGSKETEVSQYWIHDFLKSDFRTTAAQGTRVLAVAMKNASRTAGRPRVREEIVAAAMLGQNLNGQVLTTAQFLDRFNLSDDARNSVVNELRHHDLVNDRFRFSAEEFNRQLSYKTIELDNGAMLTAPTRTFDDVIRHTEPDDEGDITYSTTGKVVGQKLSKTVAR